MTGPSLFPISPTPAHTREAIAQAQQTCLSAARAIARATAAVESSRVLHAERQHWREVWNDLRHAEYLPLCCAHCRRIRTRDGAWRAIPSGMYEVIHDMRRMNLTHGTCPDCRRIVLPADTTS
jgi:hypothetical protein